MPTLTRKSFNAYKKNLNAVESRALDGFAKRARGAAKAFMDAPDEESRAVYRAFLTDEVYRRIDLGQAQAQVFADDMFDALVGFDPSPHEAFPYEAADARVRSAAAHIFEHGDVSRFVDVLESFIRQEVRGAASNAIAENVEENI